MSDTALSQQLRGFLRPARDPTADTAVRATSTPGRPAPGSMTRTYHAGEATQKPWYLAGVAPASVAEADEWIAALDSHRDHLASLMGPGMIQESWVAAGLRHCKVRRHEVFTARRLLVQDAARGARTANIAAIIGEEPTDFALLKALHVTMRTVLDTLDERGCETGTALTEEQRRLMAHVGRYIRRAALVAVHEETTP